jgi:hypothetical protein
VQLTKKLQELVDKIAEDRASLFQEVEGLSESQLDYKPAEDHWSVTDILHHLALSDEANVKLTYLMLKQAQEQSIPPDPEPDGSVLDCLDQFREPMSNPMKAPARVNPISYVPAQESLARLKASREKLLENIGHLSAYDLSQLSYPHPFMGPFGGHQWLLLAGTHESRHVAQIKRMKAGEGFPAN